MILSEQQLSRNMVSRPAAHLAASRRWSGGISSPSSSSPAAWGDGCAEWWRSWRSPVRSWA